MHSSPAERVLDGKYRLIRKLEEGGMGSVWLAEHLSLRSPVAVKLIATEAFAPPMRVGSRTPVSSGPIPWVGQMEALSPSHPFGPRPPQVGDEVGDLLVLPEPGEGHFRAGVV